MRETEDPGLRRRFPPPGGPDASVGLGPRLVFGPPSPPVLHPRRGEDAAARLRTDDGRSHGPVSRSTSAIPPLLISHGGPSERRFPFGLGGPLTPARRAALAAGALALAALALWGWRATRVSATVTGLEAGAILRPEDTEQMTVRLEVSPSGLLRDATLTLNGADVLSQARVAGDVIVWKPGKLLEDEYRLKLTVPRRALPDATLQWRFTVDGTPPVIQVPPYLPPHRPDQPATIEGRVEGAVDFRVGGKPVELDEDGRFELRYDRPPPGPVVLWARDEAGNQRRVEVVVPLPYPEVRGVHVTARAWDNARLRQGIIDLIDAGAIDTVVLTLKDESGLVGHSSSVPLARRIGAVLGLYDLKKQVDFLHSKGVRVVGRLVAFRDPALSSYAWTHGARRWVIQTKGGKKPYGDRVQFTNFAHPVVRRYLIDLAVEAARAGVDDVLYDYVRRPEGFLEDMVIPGLRGSPEDAIAEFLEASHRKLRRLGAYQGASVFGVAATRPEQTGQDILAMAGHTDYIAPMLYPSHWAKGEYRLEDPEREPYEIVRRALRDFRQQVARTGRPLVPWLQHFSLNVEYGPAEILAQVQAVRDAIGSRSWFMWDPAVTYDAAVLARAAR